MRSLAPYPPMPDSPARRASRVSAFAATAALSATQDLVRMVMPALTDAEGAPAGEPELVAEETLVLVSTTTARATEVGLKQQPETLQAARAALSEMPFLYHDYLLGLQLVDQGEEGDVEVDSAVYDRLARKAEFYTAHLPAGRFPGPRQLGDVLPLWMGRISPPKLPTTPDARLEQTGVPEALATHARLILAFARRVADGGEA